MSCSTGRSPRYRPTSAACTTLSTTPLFERYAEQGFDAAKVKVGYPTVDEDIERLELVRDAMGEDVYWVEDPVLRDDVGGCRRVAEEVPWSHLNSGEYLNLEGKLELLEERATDVLHLSGGMFSTARQEAALAGAYDVPVAIHDAIAHVCVHLAAAVPQLVCQEYWPRPWDELVEMGVEVGEASLIAPDDPGHGIRFAVGAFEEYGAN